MIHCLTRSLIAQEIAATSPEKHVIWFNENTPHEWRGRTVGCSATAGENPDNIYRAIVIPGGVRYEVDGKFDPKHRASQFVVQLGPEPGLPFDITRNVEAVEVLGAFSDRDFDVAPDGSFHLTLGGASGPGKHVATPAGRLVSVLFRDTMSDWEDQRPARLSIVQPDPIEAKPFNRDELRRLVVGRLGDHVRSWSKFPEFGFGGGLKPNTHSPVMKRDGGWGFLAGVRFSLADDEAVAVTLARGDAKYLGFQVTDPWAVTADSSKYLTSLNLAQATPDKDGNYTYVISPRDPGVANWLDTTGLHDGFGVIRWQGVPPGAKGDELLRGFRIIKVADAVHLPGIATITPAQRKTQLESRAVNWAKRLQ
jgi:hypothetical protein